MVAGVTVLTGLAPGLVIPFVIFQDDAVFLAGQCQGFVGELALTLNPALELGVLLGLARFSDDGSVALGCCNRHLDGARYLFLELRLGHCRCLTRPVGKVLVDALIGEGRRITRLFGNPVI